MKSTLWEDKLVFMTKEKRFLLFKGAKKKPCMSSEDLTIKTKIDSLKHSKKNESKSYNKDAVYWYFQYTQSWLTAISDVTTVSG